MKLQLNLKLKDSSEAVNKAEEKVKKAKKEVLPLPLAWKEIFSKKNSAPDLQRLKEVKEAMEKGIIGREEGKENKTLTKAEALRLHKVLSEITRESKLEELVETTPENYILVQTEEELHEMAQTLISEDIIAVDTETTGVDVYRDKVVGASFTAPKSDRHYYVPFRHEEGKQVSTEKALYWISRIMKAPNDKVFHNAIFDLHILKGEGITVEGKVHDTMIIQHLLNENEMSYRLKDLVTKYLRIPADNFDALFGKDCLFSTVALKYARYYACKDTHLTWKLYEFQMSHLNKPELQPLLKNYLHIEQPLIKVVFDMERVGFCLDMEEVKKQEELLEARKEELEQELKILLGDINFGSVQQLSKVLYDKKKLHKFLPPNAKKSTDSKTLKILARYDESCKLLVELRDISKQLSSFVKALPTLVKPDGRVHGSFKQTGTVTGRFSSSNPNLQQQSKPARKMFVAPEGQLILGADFSAQEPRLLAHFTQEETLLDIYRYNKDLYATLASKHYKKSYEECNKNPDGSDTKERKTFKVVVLAIMYGMTSKSLADLLGISELEADHLINGFFKDNPKVKRWVEGNKLQASKVGYVSTLFGRKRRLPDARSNDFWIKARAERQTTNARIQGSASEQTKLVMIEADRRLKAMSTETRKFELLATIHDEILFLVPEDVTLEEVKVIEEIMTQTVKLNNVSSKTDIELGKCWGDLTALQDWFK